MRFGLTQEDVDLILVPLARKGMEPVGSMGNDVCSRSSRRVEAALPYFKQLFAQVTNPPIDPIREELVTSLISYIGPKPNVLDVNDVEQTRRIEVFAARPYGRGDAQAPLFSHEHLGKVRSKVIDITYPAAWGSAGVEACLAGLCAQAVDAISLVTRSSSSPTRRSRRTAWRFPRSWRPRPFIST